MVESETFVSRRRNVSRRGPRKLFTARGLVDEIDKSTTNTNQPEICTPSATKSSIVNESKWESKSNSTIAFSEKAQDTNLTVSSLELEASLKNQTAPSSQPESLHPETSVDSTTFNSTETRDEVDTRYHSRRARKDGELIAFSAEDELHKSLEDMGCMNGFFFSGRKSKDNAMIKFSKGGDGTTALEFNMKVPVPNMNFMDKFTPSESDVHSVTEHIGSKKSNQTDQLSSSVMRQMTSRVPYKTVAELTTAANPPYESLMALSEASSEEDIASPLMRNRHIMAFSQQNEYSQMGFQQKFEVGAMSPATIGGPSMNAPLMVPPTMVAPPMQIFIDEQPCLSDDLIPVDDMPPPGMNFDLTRYHPKPLTRRPQYDVGEALLSIDSEDSDGVTDTAGDTPVSPIAAERRSFLKTDNMPSKMKNSAFPSFEEAGPSFDEYDENKPAAHSKMPSMKMPTPKSSVNEIKTPKFSTPKTSLDNKNVNVFPSPKNTIRGNPSIESSQCSAASDEAIATEEPVSSGNSSRYIGKTVNSYKKGNVMARQTKTHSLGRLRIDADSGESFAIPQDENNTPRRDRTTSYVGEQNDRTVRSSNRMSMYMTSTKTSAIASSEAQTSKYDHTGRQPLDLMVSTNLPLSPKNEEFYSPKVTTPNGRSSVRSSREPTKHRFAFEDSFDEAEFFETKMA